MQLFQTQHLQDQLDFIESRMKEQKQRALLGKVVEPLRFLVKVKKPVQRPKTPQLEFP